MRMRVFSAPTIIRAVLGAWREVVKPAKKRSPWPSFTPRKTALAAALACDSYPPTGVWIS